jgi:hypothetical protein
MKLRIIFIASIRALNARLMLSVAMLLGLGCTAPHVVEPQEQVQSKIVEQFYGTVMLEPVFGMPTDHELSVLAGFLSERLLAKLLKAKQAEACAHQRHGGTEPPLLQGALFMSLFEGAHDKTRIAPDEGRGTWLVGLTYGDGSTLVSWSDRVVLTKQSGRWVIDEIEFLGGWPFANKGKLSERLDAVVRETNCPTSSGYLKSPRA